MSIRFFVFIPPGGRNQGNPRPRGPKPWRECVAACQRMGPTSTELPDRFEPEDVLITWSPFRGSKRWRAFQAAKAAGSRVIVMENGWLSPIGDTWYFQMAFDGWNGTGHFPDGGPERWASWNVPLRPWRRDGRHVLVLGQKQQPMSDPRRMPPGWAQSVRLPTRRPVIRRMPSAGRPLAEDLRDAHCTVTWTSTAVFKGLVAGIPAFHCGPNTLCPELSKFGLDVEAPIFPDRQPVFERLAWCQWSAAEIATGEPIARLLAQPHDGLPVQVEDLPAVASQYTALGRLRDLALHLPGGNPVRRWLGMS
ncbi:hypothetical protein KXR53_25855 [Inquilinus limosus]|uniref:hypothetical protein n=1 Tax=Inquilinus limosus TaxID=171674 RepID=UPI003F1539DE